MVEKAMLTEQEIKTRIDDCLSEARQHSEAGSPNPFLPGMIGCLERMLKRLNDDVSSKNKMAGALGRLVMEDGAFMTTPLALRLLKLADDFVDLQQGPTQ
jgi:hypothetical protein